MREKDQDPIRNEDELVGRLDKQGVAIYTRPEIESRRAENRIGFLRDQMTSGISMLLSLIG